MSPTLQSELQELRDELSLRSAEINGELLSGYLPDGAAVECALSKTCWGLARRVVAAPANAAEPTLALERLIERLNRGEQAMRWELRRRERPSAIEIWLICIVVRAEVANSAEAVRDLSARLARAGRHRRAALQALCQPRVAAILNECCQVKSSQQTAGNQCCLSLKEMCHDDGSGF